MLRVTKLVVRTVCIRDILLDQELPRGTSSGSLELSFSYHDT